MKVALVTTHLPLKDIFDAITANEIQETIRITHQGLVTQFGILSPKILFVVLIHMQAKTGIWVMKKFALSTLP